jgi:serine/threonine protein kinase
LDQLARLKTALADRYSVERELGSGGMATVYLADDLKHHRKVAIKVLRPELAASLGADRFLLEVTIAAQLQHPPILPLQFGRGGRLPLLCHALYRRRVPSRPAQSGRTTFIPEPCIRCVKSSTPRARHAHGVITETSARQRCLRRHAW